MASNIVDMVDIFTVNRHIIWSFESSSCVDALSDLSRSPAQHHRIAQPDAPFHARSR